MRLKSLAAALIGVESNWQVCDQLPTAGKAVSVAPRLTVDRSCGEEAPEPTTPQTAPSTVAGSVPSDQPSEAAIQEPDESLLSEFEAERF